MEDDKGFLRFTDERREIVIPGDYSATVEYAITHFIQNAKESIEDHGFFSVALSGGSTPKAIYQRLSHKDAADIDWSRVLLFWGDERAVPKEHEDSNYKMAMDAGFSSLPIPEKNIFRMVAEVAIEENAKKYEILIEKKLPNGVFDFVMLGMGEDGHTASLFPETHGLHSESRVVVANYISKLNAWRMTLTFHCINNSHCIAIYVLGKKKAEMVKNVLFGPYTPDLLPIQRIGTPSNKAYWILDNDAAPSCSMA